MKRRNANGRFAHDNYSTRDCHAFDYAPTGGAEGFVRELRSSASSTTVPVPYSVLI